MVERFRFTIVNDWLVGGEPHVRRISDAYGDFVRHSDCAALEEKLAERVKVDERKLHDLWTMGNCRMSFAAFKDRILSALEV